MKNQKFYNLSNDHLFKEVFRKEENLKILLQDFFGIIVSKIIYKNGETLKKNKKNKHGRIDILMEINNDINCVMEMQNYYEVGFKDRLIRYIGTIISDEGLKEGESYDKLKKVKALAILNCSKKEYQSCMEAKLRDKKNNIFSDKIEFNIINLKDYNDKGNPIYKMLTCESLDEIEEYKNNKVYGPIYEKIKYYNLNEKERRKMNRLAQIIEEEKINYDEALEYGRMEGLQQGFKEGESNGIKTGEKRKSLEIAKNLLHQNIDIDIISKVTGLSSKDIKKLSLKRIS